MITDWTLPKYQDKAIRRLAGRAAQIYTEQGDKADTQGIAQGIAMDLTACHKYGCELDLEKLAGFDDANFMHDIHGINRHLDRETGELTRCFLPRSAR